MDEARRALARLRADPDAVAATCRRFGVDLLTAFGSAVQPGADDQPRDLDLAARRLNAPLDVIGLTSALAGLTGYAHIDLMDLARANPLARSHALEQSVLLFESAPGKYSRAQLAAIMGRMDTEWLRRLNLRALATEP